MSKKIDITAMKTADMVAMYNDLTGKAIKKFSDRITGEKQLKKAIEDHDAKLADVAAKLAENAAALAASAKRAEAIAPPKAAAKKAISKKVARPKKIPSELEAQAEAANLASYMASECQCPSCATEDASMVVAAGKEGTVAGDDRRFCKACKTEFWFESGKIFERNNPGRDAGAGIAASWSDPDVRAARSARHNILIGDEEYRSVKEAFIALKLPLNKHIKFRMELKSAPKGKLEFDAGEKRGKIMFKIAK